MDAEALKVAVEDLLCELRIGRDDLAVMANGYAPNYPGALDVSGRGDSLPPASTCKVQISSVVAAKLEAALG